MKISSVLFSLLLGVFISLNSIASTPSTPGPNRTFTLRLLGEPETLDWNRAHTPLESYLLMNLMEGLVSIDSSMKVVPALAQSWTVSSDGKTYTFKLRSNVKWSDGVLLKAQDFVFSWKRLLSPLTAASYAYFLYDIEGAEAFSKGTLKDFSQVGIKALNDLTLQVKLAQPVAHWIYIPNFWVTFPLREDIVTKYGNSWETPGRMVTLGPYSLAAHDLESKVVLQANPYYYGDRGNIEQVVGLIVKDDSTALTLYETGKLDFLTDLSSSDLKRLAGRPDLKTFPYLKVGYLGFVTGKYPTSNAKLRRAIAMAIDKSKIGSFLYGNQKGATSFVPPPLFSYSKELGLPYNPAKAKEELKASGIGPAETLAIDFIIPNWDRPSTIGQFIQQEIKKNLGIGVTLQPFDNKTYRAQLDLHVYPMFEASWTADFSDPDNFLSIFLSGAGNNRTTWKSPKYDELILKARRMQKEKEREKLYLAAQKILLEDAAIVPLYYEPNIALIKPRVRQLELNPLNFLFLRKVNLVP